MYKTTAGSATTQKTRAKNMYPRPPLGPIEVAGRKKENQTKAVITDVTANSVIIDSIIVLTY
jgi:hypothetical protein